MLLRSFKTFLHYALGYNRRSQLRLSTPRPAHILSTRPHKTTCFHKTLPTAHLHSPHSLNQLPKKTSGAPQPHTKQKKEDGISSPYSLQTIKIFIKQNTHCNINSFGLPHKRAILRHSTPPPILYRAYPFIQKGFNSGVSSHHHQQFFFNQVTRSYGH